MTSVSIRITSKTRKELEATLRRAFQAGDLSMVKRVTALLGIGRGEPVTIVAEGVGVSSSTVYTWLHALLLHGVAGLRVQWRGGRPRKLTQTQRERLAEIVTAGPEAAGFPTGCWHALLIQQVIAREFGVHYNVHYLATLLHNLGFSFQKARFASDHLDEHFRACCAAEDARLGFEPTRRFRFGLDGSGSCDDGSPDEPLGVCPEDRPESVLRDEALRDEGGARMPPGRRELARESPCRLSIDLAACSEEGHETLVCGLRASRDDVTVLKDDPSDTPTR